ncbi:MAG: hypothetical protein Q9186_004446 [Xanthomendoza sp. 1 TL-2023]
MLHFKSSQQSLISVTYINPLFPPNSRHDSTLSQQPTVIITHIIAKLSYLTILNTITPNHAPPRPPHSHHDSLHYTSHASATCYSGGAPWGDKGDARTKLADACSELIGNYGPLSDRKACRPGPGGATRSYEFEIRNENNYSVYISKDACVKDLGREIEYCTYGGRETVGAIIEMDLNIGGTDGADCCRGDPNSGTC